MVWLRPMNVILYARVSTQDQSCEAQLMELREVARTRKWTVVREVTDVISGAKSDREGLSAVMEAVRRCEVQAVCAVRIDRMARSLGHFAQLAAEFLLRDVALILTAQGIDTSKSNPCGRLQMNVLAAVAAFERDLIRERTRAGLAVARAKGKRLGRPSPKMVGVDQAAVVAAWKTETRGTDYARLGEMLGGVSAATAWRMVKRMAATEAQKEVTVDE